MFSLENAVVLFCNIFQIQHKLVFYFIFVFNFCQRMRLLFSVKNVTVSPCQHIRLEAWGRKMTGGHMFFVAYWTNNCKLKQCLVFVKQRLGCCSFMSIELELNSMRLCCFLIALLQSALSCTCNAVVKVLIRSHSSFELF